MLRVLLLCVFWICFELALCSANSLQLTPGQTVTILSPLCSEYSNFIFQATKWCEDVLINLSTPANSLIQPIILASTQPMTSPLDNVNWKNVNPYDLSLRIQAREPKYAVGPIYISIYTHCLSATAGNTSAAEIAFNITAQHVPFIPLAGVPTLTPFEWAPFTANVAESYWYFEFCEEPSTFNNCPLDITVEIQNSPVVCPITIVSNDVQFPTRKNLAWSISCSTLLIAADTPLANPGFYYGAVNSWCTPDQYCADPTRCYPCSPYSLAANQAVSLRVNFTCDPSASSRIPASVIPPIPISMTSNSNGVLTGIYPNLAFDCSNSNNQTTYFSFVVTDPCVDLFIEVNAIQGQTDLLISRNGIQNPSYNTLIWPDWWWGPNNVTISHTDQNFAPDTYYVTVLAYCGSDATTYNPYPIVNLKISQIPVGLGFAATATQEGNRLLSVFDKATAANYNYYEMCISPSLQSQYNYAAIQYVDLDNSGKAVTVSVEENSGQIIDNAGSPYAFPLVVVDQFIQFPVAATAAYHLYIPLIYELGSSGARQSLVLWNNSAPSGSVANNNISGYFYLAVYGRCYPSGQCGSNNFIGCSLCENYPSNFNLQLNLQQSAITPSNSINNNDSGSTRYSGGQVAGITVGVSIGVAILTVLVMYGIYEKTSICGRKSGKHAALVKGETNGNGHDRGREHSLSSLNVHNN